MSKLICTYTTLQTQNSTIESIMNTYTLPLKKIYIFSLDNTDEFICSYNILELNSLLPNTMILHRKSDTNTLYTINGINVLIRSLNNEILDENYIIEWQNYKNSIITVKEKMLKICKLSLKNIVQIDNYNKDISR